MNFFSSRTNLHRFAVVTSFSTFLLIFAGGLVTSTQSGLSVPDWPTTYGHFMFAYPLDEMVGGIFYEHSHRMIASTVGFLTVLLALWIWKVDDRKWMKVFGFSALGAVIVQGILGGLTVQYLLPTPISVSHATLAQTFFAAVTAIALFTSAWWRDGIPTATPEPAPQTFTIALAAVGAVYVQLILGALMRHTQAGLAVPDIPLAYGQVLPSLSPEALSRYNSYLLQSDIRIAADDPVTASQITIHMLHRIWAVVTACMVTWSSIRLLKYAPVAKRIPYLGAAQIVLVAVQITLGILTVLSRKAVDITTLHVSTGALLLVVTTSSMLHLARVHGIVLSRRPRLTHAREALS